ncbi:MAG: methyl-accepting chemotaxis protein [Desulfobacteraceae bacterium]|jgi:methyl-accepting chemotaxis protein
MKDRLKLWHRILLGYMVPVLLFMMVAIMVFASMQTYKEHLLKMNDAYAFVVDIKGLALNLAAMQRSARGYILTGEKGSRERYAEAEKEFQEAIKPLTGMVRESWQEEGLRRLRDIEGKINELLMAQVDLVDKGKRAMVIGQFGTHNTISLATEFKNTMDELQHREMDNLKKETDEVNSGMGRLSLFIVLGPVFCLILSLMIGLWIANTITSTIKGAITALSSTSTEIATTSSQHERTASMQAAMVSETTSTFDEVGASSRQVAEQAESAASLAQRATILTKEGSDTVRQTMEGVRNLKDKVVGIANQIFQLGDKTSQIGSLANLVMDLAGQTNMLALNAAVEAARAGEHGKGFAVVATEVRKLADQSKRSAEQANVLIGEIQKATNATIMATEEGTKRVEDVNRMTEKVDELFGSLAMTAGSVYENAQQVLLNARQQSDALKQVTEAMNEIGRGAKETAAGISQTKVGIQELDRTAQILKATV